METIVFHIDAFWTRGSNTFRAEIKGHKSFWACAAYSKKSTFFLETKEYPLSEL